jgi:hypothetical protein
VPALYFSKAQSILGWLGVSRVINWKGQSTPRLVTREDNGALIYIDENYTSQLAICGPEPQSAAQPQRVGIPLNMAGAGLYVFCPEHRQTSLKQLVCFWNWIGRPTPVARKRRRAQRKVRSQVLPRLFTMYIFAVSFFGTQRNQICMAQKGCARLLWMATEFYIKGNICVFRHKTHENIFERKISSLPVGKHHNAAFIKLKLVSNDDFCSLLSLEYQTETRSPLNWHRG